MPVRTVKPITPGQRGKTISTFEEITKSKPEKSLTRSLKKSGGRNNMGRVTSRRRGGGHKRKYRIIDFKRDKFDIPFIMLGSDFQKQVWEELINIPYGTTVSYKALSEKIGNSKAVRAVANANGANAISIIIPCHRVVASNGGLGGYAGGLKAKKLLLNVELANLKSLLPK